ncbi:MAG: FKBP-type peptidyl-prolyl cis-trans isomerase [Bacteroidota bacterium]
MKSSSLVRAAVLLLVIAAIAQACSSTGANSANSAVMEGGYSYLHHEKNEGPKPEAGQYAYFHYSQRIDDSLMESSRMRDFMPKMMIPTEEQLQQQPNPIVNGLKKMAQGDSLSVGIPIDSLQRTPPDWANKEFMYFDIRLEAIKSAEEYQVDQQAEQAKLAAERQVVQAREQEVADFTQQVLADYKAGKLEVKSLPSGLKYVVHEAGEGPNAAPNQRVDVQYYGVLAESGEMFDNSFKRGDSFQFVLGVGSVIRGWDEGIAQLNTGSKATLFIPFNMGYGETGSPPTIPPSADLVFYVELEGIQ